MNKKLNSFLFAIITLFCTINVVQAESSEIYFIPESNSLVKLSIINNGENSFDSAQKKSIIEAVKIWSNVIKNPQQTATFTVVDDPDPELSGNATGLSNLTEVQGETLTMTFVNARILGKTVLGTPDKWGDAKVSIGISDDWILDTYTKPRALYHSDNTDFTTVIVHEIEHALGVRTSLEEGQYTFPAKISNWDKNIAIYTTSNLVIYFFKYDFGGEGWQGSFTLFNTFGGGIQILAMMIMYPVLRKFCSNIKVFYICLTSAIIGYGVLFGLTFLDMSNVMVLFVPAFFIFSANGVLNVLTTVFLANTVDYGDMKNYRRDESVIFSMQTFVVKLGSGVSALIASISLSINHLKADSSDASQAFDFSKAVSDSSKLGLRMTMTIIPIIGLIIAVIVFKKKFILTEKKMDEINLELRNRKMK